MRVFHCGRHCLVLNRPNLFFLILQMSVSWIERLWYKAHMAFASRDRVPGLDQSQGCMAASSRDNKQHCPAAQPFLCTLQRDGLNHDGVYFRSHWLKWHKFSVDPWARTLFSIWGCGAPILECNSVVTKAILGYLLHTIKWTSELQKGFYFMSLSVERRWVQVSSTLIPLTFWNG